MNISLCYTFIAHYVVLKEVSDVTVQIYDTLIDSSLIIVNGKVAEIVMTTVH